ncbi:zinc-finger homeodomain protein 10-like [Vicia villosa]|uniref:zinc-finger homeodomain protein 10-like n=1 Tax=Vicia villosa TaxID=3911 RepID=UPI00273BA1EC|nr:zinc-finger homeodomain protein 10-like [Vicia villosa]
MMEILTTTSTTTTTTNTNTTPLTTISKPSEPESENPTRIQPINTTTTTSNITKPLSFSNGVLKRHHPNTHNNVVAAVTYKECLKNHVATLGGHALDGCCEFMPSPTATSDDPASIKCAACGCHRNFHRREPEEPISTVFEYQPHHRHHPPPPPLFQSRSPSSPSPPPISSYPSAPHMLLALSGAGVGFSIPPENTAAPLSLGSPMGASRKRFRTKFTQEQKDKMHEFAERVGWKMQKRDEEMVNGFCNEVGVDRSVLKVWMHNNKNTLGRKLSDHVNGDGAAVRSAADGVSGGGFGVHENDNNNGINVAVCATNGSSSSS